MAKTSTNEITLNFLPIEPFDFQFECYFKPVLNDSKKHESPNLYTTWFKTPQDVETQRKYVVLSLEELEGFSKRRVCAQDNSPAALWFLNQRILPQVAEFIRQKGYTASIEERFSPTLKIVVSRHAAGDQGFLCQFAWLPAIKRHGLIVQYKFFSNFENKDIITAQKLSLSLDSYGRANRNFYSDKQLWLNTLWRKVLQGFVTESCEEKISFSNYAKVISSQLPLRRLEFGGKQLGCQPYAGIRQHGVYKRVQVPPTFFFVFRRTDIALARFLYSALVGTEFHDKFPGMESFFHIEFGAKNVKYEEIQDYSNKEITRVARAIQEANCANPIAIILETGDEEEYLLQKSEFLSLGIPTQGVLLSKLQQGDRFQWNVGSIALQLFCKAGGIPWCVYTQRRHDLIVGVSQVWERNEARQKRFIAYSVTTDASGLFKDISTLSDQDNESDYLYELAQKVRKYLENLAVNKLPKRIVLHCSYRLKKTAIDTIKNAIQSLVSNNEAMPQIVLLRVNSESIYSGFDLGRDSCVPDENTIVSLGRGGYLVWPDGTKPNKAIMGRPTDPIYVKFDLSIPRLTNQDELAILEDLCNLSGANWRGFNARAKPVSVFYCRLVGEMLRNMMEFKITPPNIEQFIPWFL